jgi:hypothetical protein
MARSTRTTGRWRAFSDFIYLQARRSRDRVTLTLLDKVF